MKKTVRVGGLICIFSFLHSWGAAVHSATPVYLRVRVAEAVPRAIIRGFDLRIHETEKEELKMRASPNKTTEWEFRCQDGTIRAIQLHSPQNFSMIEMKEPVSIQTPGGFLNYESLPYRGEIKIYSTGLLCEVVNEVELEKYLEGLVNSEFSSKWSEEAVAAQVIAARTYAYYQLKESEGKKGSRFDVDATVKDQVYGGPIREDFRASRVVGRTRGLILTGKAGDSRPPIKAFYHSTCGGRTELPENVWKSKFSEFKRKIICPFCRKSPKFLWQLDLTRSEIITALFRKMKKGGVPGDWPKNSIEIVKQGSLLDLKVDPPHSEDRAIRVITVWADGKNKVELPLSASQFREWVGFSKLKSTYFQILPNRVSSIKSWHFSGRGNGHGVGMCQWGAKVMGEKGYNMESILNYYYPDAILRKLW